MEKATDKRPYSPPRGSLSERLMNDRERILASWVARQKSAIDAAKDEQDLIIVDTIPAFLENLAQALDRDYPRELATEGTTVATEHGGERARMTRYPPGSVIREFQILRDVIIQSLSAEEPLDAHAVDIIIKSIDQTMTESLTAYFLVHQGIREQFTTTLTHDLRNPLAGIRSSADLILRFYPDRLEKIPHLASRIVDCANRIDEMTQDLLDASRAQFGERISFNTQEFDMKTLIEEILAQFATVHGDRFEFFGGSVHGHWNQDAFRRAIENLVNNAIKYGDPAKPITTRLEEVQGRVIVSVRNEGEHIPAEDQETIFRSFMRTQSAKSSTKSGWGLGLAMVRGMAEGHGGSITVDSAPDRGTTFIIDVPIDSRPYLVHPVTPGTPTI